MTEWSRLELNQLAYGPGVYSAGRLPRTNPETQKRKKPPRFPWVAFTLKRMKTAQLHEIPPAEQIERATNLIAALLPDFANAMSFRGHGLRG